MSERGQKIFKWIVWLVIIGYLIGCIARMVYLTNYYEKDPLVSETEWIAMLSDSFGTADFSEVEKSSSNAVTGRYAAITAFEVIGQERAELITGKQITTDEQKVAFAVEYEIISQKQLGKKLVQSQAQQIVTNTMKIYSDPKYYPQYCDMEPKVNIVDADKWNISQINSEENTLVADIKEPLPQPGEVFMYTDNYGIAHAKRAEGFQNIEGNTYLVYTSEISDLSELFDVISFSGSGDFSYLSGEGRTQVNEESSEEESSLPMLSTGVCAARGMPTMLAGWDLLEEKTAISCEGKEIVNCDIAVDAFFTSDQEMANFTITYDGITLLDKTIGDDDVDASTGMEVSVTIRNFAISTSGYFEVLDPGDEKNWMHIIASADSVEIDTTAKFAVEKSFEIASFDVPISVTGGTISVGVSLNLCMTADGKISITYTINKPTVGFKLSTKDGLKKDENQTTSDVSVDASVEIGVGFSCCAYIKVLKQYTLIDPGVEVMAYANASTIGAINGYTPKPEYYGKAPCIELKVQLPVVTLHGSMSDDDATPHEKSLGKLLIEAKNIDADLEIIAKDSPKIHKVMFHMEIDNKGKLTVKKVPSGEGHQSVCTHIQKSARKRGVLAPELMDSPSSTSHLSEQSETTTETDTNAAEQAVEDVGNQISDKVDSAEEAAQSQLEQSLENAFNTIFMDSCGSCN